MIIRGFTLLETVVVMILSIIVIGIIVMGYNLFFFDFKKQIKIQSDEKNLGILMGTLNEDVDKAYTIKYLDGSIILDQPNRSFIKYSYFNEGIIRVENMNIDTFQFIIQRIDYYMFSVRVKENEMLINKINIILFQKKLEKEFTIYKCYDENILFEEDLKKIDL
jgi:hypothetical protein